MNKYQQHLQWAADNLDAASKWLDYMQHPSVTGRHRGRAMKMTNRFVDNALKHLSSALKLVDKNS